MRKGQKKNPSARREKTYVERIEKRTKKKHPVGSRTKNLRGTDGAKDEGAPRRKPNEESPWNEWSHGQRRTPQEAARRTEGERMDTRITQHPAGSRTKHLRKGLSQGQRRTYVEKIEIRIEKTRLMICFYLSFQAECPTVLCSGRRWRGLYAGRDLLAWWRTSARAGLWKSPAAPLKAGVGRKRKSVLNSKETPFLKLNIPLYNLRANRRVYVLEKHFLI